MECHQCSLVTWLNFEELIFIRVMQVLHNIQKHKPFEIYLLCSIQMVLIFGYFKEGFVFENNFYEVNQIKYFQLLYVWPQIVHPPDNIQFSFVATLNHYLVGSRSMQIIGYY